ncbi:tail fiber domain-containing protein [Paracoccus sp. ME4]|uniref:phage tail fiber protein n=1 Tax=Paracoccus sp. ME4 TaxID=3138066 RepID=UPI00398B8554
MMTKFNKGPLAASTALLTILAAAAGHAQDGRSDGGDVLDDLSNPAYDSNTSVGTIPGDNLGNHMADGDLDMRQNRIVNVGNPPAVDNDLYAVNVTFLRDYVLNYGRDNLGDHVATQTLIMGDFPVKLTAQPTDPNDAVNKAYVDTAVEGAKDNLGNHVAEQNLVMGDNRITGLANPSSAKDAVNLDYLQKYVEDNGDHLGNHLATQQLDMASFAIINLPTPAADTHAATKLYVDGLFSGNSDDIEELRKRQIKAGTGLSGGGPLSSDVTLSFDTSWGDGRYALASRMVTGTDGISGGGALTGNQVLRVDGTVVRTAGAQTIAGAKTFSTIITGNLSGNAGTATRLQFPRAINGVAFDGSANITLPTVNLSGNQTVSGLKAFAGGITVFDDVNSNPSKAIFGRGGGQLIGLHGSSNGNFISSVSPDGAPKNLMLSVAGGSTQNVFTFGYNGQITGLTAPTVNSSATNKLYVDGAIADAIAKNTYSAGTGLALSAANVFSVNSTVFRNDVANGGSLSFANGNGRGVRFWNSDVYSNYMSVHSDPVYGGRLDTTSDYNMYFTMGNGASRGFVFKNGADPVFQIDGSGRLWGRDGTIETASEFVSRSANNYRLVGGDYGSFWRNDGSNIYLMLTNSGNQLGSWNGLRPFSVAAATGKVTLGNGLLVNNHRIEGVANPTTDQDAANKRYVDDSITGAVSSAAYSAGTGLSLDSSRAFSFNTSWGDARYALRGRAYTAGTGLTGGGDLSANRSFSFDTAWGDARYAMQSRSIVAGTGLSGGGNLSMNRTFSFDTTWGDTRYATRARALTTGTGLLGGGDLSANRSFSFDTSWGDARYAMRGRSLTAGTGLTGGGDLSANRTFSVDSTVFRNDAANGGDLSFVSGNGRGMRFWNNDSYKIYMSNRTDADHGGRLDPSSDYNMYFLMAGGSNRGFVFKNGANPVFQVDGGGRLYGTGGTVSFGDPIDMANLKITRLAAPTAAADAATKAYVDANKGTIYSAGGGLNLSGNSFSFNTTWGDARYALRSRSIDTGYGLDGGGNLTVNRTISLAANQRRVNAASVNPGVMAHAGDTRTTAQFYSGTDNPNATNRLNYNGAMYATNYYSQAYYYFSDRNLKKDIETIGRSDGMSIIRDLRPVSYTWKQDDKKALGVIAQEVEEVVPTAVTVTEGGERAVDYIQLIAPMLAAIQELDGRVQALETAAR